MARINVDDELLSFPRFQALVRRLNGDTEKALGRLIRFWWAAQRHWGQNRELVPIDEFELGDCEHLLEVGLAVRRETGVYARGAEKHFEWYFERLEAARLGGKKSVETRRQRDGTAVPKNARNRPENETPKQDRSSASNLVRSTSKQNRSTASDATEAKPNPLAPVLTPAPDMGSKEPKRESVTAGAVTRSPSDLFDLWNSLCGPRLAKVDKLTDDRVRMIRARLKEEPDLNYWRGLIKRLAVSDFACGSKGWRADFDWLVENKKNHVKVALGRYDDPDPGGPGGGKSIASWTDFLSPEEKAKHGIP
jgi:hypothetical protein